MVKIMLLGSEDFYQLLLEKVEPLNIDTTITRLDHVGQSGAKYDLYIISNQTTQNEILNTIRTIRGRNSCAKIFVALENADTHLLKTLLREEVDFLDKQDFCVCDVIEKVAATENLRQSCLKKIERAKEALSGARSSSGI